MIIIFYIKSNVNLPHNIHLYVKKKKEKEMKHYKYDYEFQWVYQGFKNKFWFK